MKRVSSLLGPRRGSTTHATTTTSVVERQPNQEEDKDEQLSDPVRRRRHQYRVYQQRRRARLQATTVRLEREVQALVLSIAALQHQNLHLFQSRGTHDGAPAKLVTTFYRIFEHGLVPSQSDSQDQFLRSMMTSDVRGPDFRGIDEMVEMWGRCASRVVWTRTLPRRMNIVTLDESTVVLVDVAISMHLNRMGVEHLCPGVGRDEFTAQLLLTNKMAIDGFVRFEFDTSGRVTWLSTDIDLVSGMLRVLGSLSRVNACYSAVASLAWPDSFPQTHTGSSPTDHRGTVATTLRSCCRSQNPNLKLCFTVENH